MVNSYKKLGGPLSWKEVFKRDSKSFYLSLLAALLLPIYVFFVSLYLIKYSHYNILVSDERNTLNEMKIAAEKDFHGLITDIKFLSSSYNVKRFALAPNHQSKFFLEKEFLTIVNLKPSYFQIRFIDIKGKEKIRIENKKTPKFAKPNELQNKSQRYYFTNTTDLNDGDFYISRLDLNIENGAIENPQKPTIRISSPVYSGGELLGIVVINYSPDNILKNLIQDSNGLIKRYLVNADGFYLKSPHPELDWAFMHNQEESFKRSSPKLWNLINESDKHKIKDDNQITIFEKLDVSQYGYNITHHSLKDLFFISAIDNRFYSSIFSRSQIYSTCILFVISTIFSALLVFYIVTQKKQKIVIEHAKDYADKVSKAKTIFLSTMNHELRTPLNGIIMASELMQNTKLTKQQNIYAQTIGSSADLMLQIVNNILDFSKIESGKSTLLNEPFRLSSLSHNVMPIIKPLAVSKGLDFQMRIQTHSDYLLIGDSVKLSQIILNLANNALKFTKKGYVHINIEEKSHDEEKVTIKFSVKDSGLGISPEKQSELFKEFVQADISHERDYGGTGLGLSICQKLAHLMGGEVKIKSEIGKGSIFFFELTFKISDKKIKNQISSTKHTSKYSILLAEDNEVNQYLIKESLTKEGHKVIVADDGEKAVKLAQEHDFDLILMDMQMPKMDGLQATKAIRSFSDHKKANTYIIALTANASSEAMQECLHAGTNDFISKPVKPLQLITKLEENIHKK